MRSIDTLIFHCSATPADMWVDADMIREWHLENGWTDIGYHFVILRNGAVQVGRPIDQIGAHVAGHNTGSIGVCLIGGKEATRDDHDFYELFTVEQFYAASRMVNACRTFFPTIRYIKGHNDFTEQKLCPGFKVSEYLQRWIDD